MPFASEPALRTSPYMQTRLLGFVDGRPATFLVDPSSPHSTISRSFLFQNNVNATLNARGRDFHRATLLIPTLGGFYTSSSFYLLGAVGDDGDITLGADWLSFCRPTSNVNSFGHPSPDTVTHLPDGHMWTACGTCVNPVLYLHRALTIARTSPPLYSPPFTR